METTTISTKTGNGARSAAVNGLAIVGFIVLVLGGMALAVYAARFVPTAISRIGGAAVYLSSVFVSNDAETNLEVVPTETVPFDESNVTATTTPVAVTPAAPATPPAAPVTPAPTAGTPTNTVYPIGGTVVQVPLTGLSDLTVDITATGYLTSSDTKSFVKSDTVPDGKRGAVKFSIINAGTNASGAFTFDAELPTTSTYTFHSGSQQSLNPGERIDYVLGFDRTRDGKNRTITVTVDPKERVTESNERNNSDSVTLTIEG